MMRLKIEIDFLSNFFISIMTSHSFDYDNFDLRLFIS